MVCRDGRRASLGAWGRRGDSILGCNGLGVDGKGSLGDKLAAASGPFLLRRGDRVGWYDKPQSSRGSRSNTCCSGSPQLDCDSRAAWQRQDDAVQWCYEQEVVERQRHEERARLEREREEAERRE